MIETLKCPYCNGNMEIKEVHCENCNVTIRGDFAKQRLSSLTNDQFEFALNFLIHRGNLKDLEKIYDLSYPTLRNRLNTIASILAGKVKSEELNEDILSQIDSGEISVEEALKILELDGGVK